MILEKVKSDLKTAMKTGDKVKVSVLRMLISATKNREIELKRPLEDEETISSSMATPSRRSMRERRR